MAPTLVASYFLESPAAPGGSGDSATLVTPSFTPSNGEVIVVKAQTWDKGTASGTPSGGGLTYAPQAPVAPAVFATYGRIFTTTVSGSPGAMTVTLSAPAAASYHSMCVERWSGAQLAATPAVATANYSVAGAPSATITTVANNSVVSWLNGDDQNASPAGAVYLSGATNDGLADGSGAANSVQYYAWQPAATAGSQTFGMSAPTGQKWAAAAIEIQAAASGSTDDAPAWQFSVIAPGWTAPGGSFQPAMLGAADLPTIVAVDDPATAAEALTATVAAPLAETAGAVDALTVSATVSLAEAGTGSDAIAAGQPVPVSDTANATDALTVSAAVALADTGSASDTLAAVTSVALADTATGADALSLAAAVPLADTAAGADALAEAATVPLSDSAAAADVLSVGGSAAPSLPDTASAADSLTVAVSALLTETAAGTDVVHPAAALTLAESAVAAELLSEVAALALADVATASDVAVGVLVPDVTRGSAHGRSRTGPDAAGRQRTGPDITGHGRTTSRMEGA